jgi:hypothetical protein
MTKSVTKKSADEDLTIIYLESDKQKNTSTMGGDDVIVVDNTLESPFVIEIEGDGKKANPINSGKIDEIVDKVFNKVDECNFASGKTTGVCAPNHLVDKMKDYLSSKGHTVGSTDHKNIVNKMKDLLNCKSESCIFRREDFTAFAKLNNLEDVLNKFFKPEGPALTFGLLSNFNIDDVLDQFEKRFADRKFLHIPFQMRDFERVGTQLATVDLAQMFKKGYKTFGVVLNTDYSNGRGIHWFCLFGEHYGNKIVLEYFNSSGKQALPEVQAWLQKTKHHLHKELGIPVEIYYNVGIEYQDDDHSCGVYSLAYIWLRLENVPAKWFAADNFNDSLMHKLRKNLFRWEK